MRPLALGAPGVVSAFGIGVEAFDDAMRRGDKGFRAEVTAFAQPEGPLSVAEVANFDPRPVLGDKGLRNHDRITRLALVAARRCLEAAAIKREGAFVAPFTGEAVGVVSATAYASIEAVTELDRVARLEDPRYLNPGRFPNTVTNSASGYVSIWEGLKAFNVAVTNGPTSGLDVFDAASMYLADGRAEAALVGGVEALSEGLWRGFDRVGMLDRGDGKGARLGEGAAFFAVETLDRARRRGVTPGLVVSGYGSTFAAPDDTARLVTPSAEALREAIGLALETAGCRADAVSLVIDGTNGYEAHDAVEAQALGALLPGASRVSPKMALGETLGAAGSLALVEARRRVAAGHRGPILVTALGYYGNASALVCQGPENLA
ncbi:MAG: hypothetical protein JNK72_12275 [Myxococcales bacterium]|nr:hypothetical protein [Myxococcales bacterium]